MQSSNKVNILLVDDREEGLIALEAVLNRPHFNLIKARSGKEALARVLENDFAVILMDVQMPDMDGFETVSVIKQREKSKNIPVIFLTAISKDTNFVRQGYESGAVDYIFKPFDPTILRSKVEILVDLFMKTQQVREQSELLRMSEIRERARQLAALQLESLNRYRHLADAVPHIIWKFQGVDSLDYCNRIWIDYSGMTLEQSSGKSWQSAVHPEDLVRFLEKLNEARQLQSNLSTECRLLRNRDQTYRWHMLKGVPEIGFNGEITGWIITNTDIEDLKRIEIDLTLAKEQSTAASVAKSAFLANMSHEIRTPLGIVLGFAEMLGNPEITEEDRKSALRTVKRNGELLSRLIGDILDLSKIEAGHLHVEKTKFSLPDLITSATEYFHQQAGEKGIAFKLILQNPIPVEIESDPMRLRQVISNLLGNAIKFTQKGEVLLKVFTDKDHQQLKIEVIDTGVGISAEQAQKLFQPFIQADNSTTRRFGGTGLGLSLSKKLANSLGGDVHLTQSQVGKGSIFTITVATGPLKNTKFIEHLNTPVQKADEPKQKESSLVKMKILVVEDSPENQIVVSHFLRKAGATVALADNGQDGVDKALAGNYDLVLMDIQMPVLDGYQATRLLREKSFTKPIIALTAHALKEERDRSIAAGCNDHLTKPVNREDLINRVAGWRQHDQLNETTL